MKRRRAFTLIELLIVVAMLAILSGAFFTVVVFTIRAEVEEQLHSTLRQEGLSVVRAILRDAHTARAEIEAAGTLRRDDQTLILDMGNPGGGSGRRIAYRLYGPRLERLVWNDIAASPTVQLLAGQVQRWRIDRSDDGLVRFDLELAIYKYVNVFTEHYTFATRVAGLGSQPGGGG
jgi:prepilin-type N-terminal cleavage/methylation domain-containing protein